MADALTQSTPELLPCPFCGIKLNAYSEGEGYYHVVGNCTLAGFEFPADGYSEDRWNARIEHSTPDRNAVLEEAAKVAERHAVFEEAYPATDSALWLSGYDAAVTDIVADIRSLSNMRGTDND